MFQYAFGRAAALRLSCPTLELDTTGFGKEAAIDTPRAYGLHVFNINATIAPEEKVKKYSSGIRKLLSRIGRKLSADSTYVFRKGALPTSCDGYFSGYWQSEKYFLDQREVLLKDFSLKNPLSAPAEEINTDIASRPATVSLHVRRGDYINNIWANNHHGICSVDYYQNALLLMKSKLGSFALYVFSDDIGWAENNIAPITPPGTHIVYVSKPSIQDFEDITLMSHCGNHIIANSTYSWWGAWLNPRPTKIVIAPSQWVANPKTDTRDVTPASWIRM